MAILNTDKILNFSSCFKNRRVVVVGGTSGIGYRVASDLCNLGANVFLVGRSETKLIKVKNEFPEIITLDADVSNYDGCLKLASKIKDKTDYVDHLVITCGKFKTTPIKSTIEHDWDVLLQINLSAVFWLIKIFYSLISCSKDASIVVISSILAYRGAPHVHAYSAAKGGLLSLVRSLSVELAKDNIRINAVSPGHVNTQMITKLIDTPEKLIEIQNLYPLGRIGEPKDVSPMIIFLLSPYASWITGCDYLIDGGRFASD